MKLKVKEVGLSAGGVFVAVLNELDAQVLDLRPGDRVSIKRLKLNKEVICVVNISSKGVKKGEIGFFEEAFDKIKLKKGSSVEVDIADKPRSLDYIKRKLEGGDLTWCEMNELVKDIVHDEFSDVELTYFISGCYTQGLNLKEAAALTDAIVKNGETLKLKSRIILDKHCIGGVPGNRTTMVVVPIIAALGYKIAKTSSRSITSPSGTADTMEVLAPVNLSVKKVKKVIKKTNGCIVWGGGVNLAAADDKLIKIRHPLSIDPTGMLLASIMAKKKAVGATHILIDIPWGRGSKIRHKRDALKLRKMFVKIAKMLKVKVRVVLTDGTQPVGNGIGPALEARDVISVLKGEGPVDFREKSIFLASELLKMVGVFNAKKKVVEVLDSGKAYEKFRAIIVEQGGRKRPLIPMAKLLYEYKATKNGIIKEVHNKELAKVARFSGSPEDKESGIYLRFKKRNIVKKGNILFTIYAKNKTKLETAIKYLRTIKPIIY
ncbi:thymidine phosphorylase [archaeon]|jgi:putative thymidine phosphorylase|nr:thymidine phosphorylase [archaeon]MBT4440499.1 thymidine phosphorylase [archaeon]